MRLLGVRVESGIGRGVLAGRKIKRPTLCKRMGRVFGSQHPQTVLRSTVVIEVGYGRSGRKSRRF